MKLKILNQKAEEKGSIDVPSQFKETPRHDLIKRAVETIRANTRQPYGAKPEAGLRHSTYLSKRRRAYKGTYGPGRARTPRKVMSSNGLQFHHVGAQVPNTVGGRRAHPPKAAKIWNKDLNKKERQKAIRSALSGTLIKELAEKRGHKVPSNYPFIISDELSKIEKTADLKKALEKQGFKEELTRTSKTKIRQGKGKNRGRKYKNKTSILFVTAESNQKLEKAASNLKGCDVTSVDKLNTLLLAPGAVPGRLTLYTESAVKKIKEENLFQRGESK